MPAATTGKNLPYPLGTDRVMDGDDQIRKLAQSVDNMVQVGRVTVPITANNANANVTWTFPIAYAANPTVIATPIGGASISNGAAIAVGTITTTNVSMVGRVASGASTFDVFLIAVGPVVAVT
jgi:uncharacterized membrane protein (DUF485 family)